MNSDLNSTMKTIQNETNPSTEDSKLNTESRSPSKDSQKKRSARPKPVYLWTNADILKWFKRHCAEFYNNYGYLFAQHDITGRSLMRMNGVTLEKLGIINPTHRDEILREILKLKLKTDIIDLRDLQNKDGELWHQAEMTK
ncbi:hypothetical protein CHUAL_006452 [Chamberlinius hualienensis]